MWWSKRKSRVTEGAQALASPMIMSLEPRMLFDGAVAATVADAAQSDAQPTAEAAKTPTADQPADTHAPQGQADATEAAVPGKSVVFVDSRVKDAGSLLQGVAPGTEVVQLDATKDGLQQIADYLDSHQGVSSVQIIAHGNAGDLWLGNSYLSADNVQARSEVLAQIGQDMNAGGDILIYGCYTAEGDRGLSLVNSLAQLTGRDVAASDDRTGLGGDWDLEIATGTIESANVLSANAMSEYQWGLATWTATNNLNSGIGSLRAALSSAQNGDIVTFNSTMTVSLTQVLVVDKNITIDGDLNNDNVADVTLDGQYRTQIMQVTSGTTATLDGLVITRGMVAGNGGNGGDDALVSQGGGIYNAGTLTLRNVTVTANAASGGGGGGGVTPQYAGGGGGGGGAITGGTGGKGGDTLNSTGSNGTAGQGGAGGGFFNIGGRGGSTTGGAGGAAYPGYSTGSAGGTASSGGLSIGGGGGGDGYNDIGGAGGGAVGGIYNDTGATLRIIGNSVISNNVGAGGGGGGGGAGGSYYQAGGAGGVGVGAIWNKGSILITAANFAALAGNVGGSGVGGTSAGSAGVSPASVANVYGDGGTINTNYVPDETPPTATVVVANTNLNSGGTSTVTITFSEAVTGLTAADLTVQNGSVGTLTSGDGGITWTGTLTAASNIADTTNIITLNNTGVADLAGNAGVGTTDSNNYAVDTQRPTATIVVADNALNIGETSLVTITFSEAVTGFTLADLTVANGSLSGLSSSDGGITWTATLTPSASVSDATNLIILANTGVADAAGNNGSGTTSSNNYAVDTQRPTASIVVADTSLSVGETSLVTITFNEAVTGFTAADLTVANGTVTGLSSGDGGITWTGTLTPSASTSDASNLITLDNTGVSDAAGNAGSGTTDSNNYAIDTARPTAIVVVADPTVGAGETSVVTITFSEAVTGFTLADMTVANGSLSGLSTSDNITYTATFTPSAGVSDATNLITLNNTGVVDGAGNTGSGTTDSNNYAVDTQRPTATIVVADTALSVGETSLVTITFSEAVSGFDNSDLSIANGTLSAVSSSDGGITWTATFTPALGVSDTSNVIVLNNTGVSDAAGNTGTGTTNSNNYQVDTNVPTATIVIADATLSIGETSLVTVTFNSAVSGFDNADLTVSNGTLSTMSSTDGGVTWTATFTPSASISDTSNVITLDNTGLINAAGNAGVGTTDSNNYVVDTVRPTATIVVADTAIGAGETSLVTITFSEAVTAFTSADLTVANGVISGLSSSDGGITWTATFTPTNGVNDSSNVISLNSGGIIDLAGNVNVGTADSNNYALDTQRPTATVVLSDSSLRPGETAQVTITFSEAVTGFSNDDLSVANGTLSAVSSSDGGLTWTATFTPTLGVSDTTNLIILDNTGVSDAAGNTGTGTTDSANYAVETRVPTATVVVADTALSVGETSLVTITFSEAVSGFDNSDLTVSNGTLSNVSSTDGGVTWTATFTPASNVTDTSNLISLDTTGVSNVSGNTGVGVVDSNNYAIDTVRPGATIVVGDTTLGIGQTTTVTISFTEAVSGFDLSDLSVANGVLSNLASSDAGLTWTATLTPTAGINDATNLILLDASNVQDSAGNAGVGIAISANYALDATRPTATIVVANPNLGVGQTTLVTFTFTEAVTDFDLSDLSVTNGDLSNLTSSDGGRTWTATFTPAANLTDPSNFIALDSSNVSDLSGNAGSGVAVSNNYAIDTVVPNDVKPPPEFLTSDPVTVIPPSEVPLQPIVFMPPTGNLGSPLGFPPLFEQRDVGGLDPIGSIFINRGELAPSYIAQVFSSDAAGDGSGQGFLGFGGGDGGVFGSSTISGLFNQDAGSEGESLDAFDNQSIKGGEASQGMRGVFGAPTLGQQLQQLKDTEQRQVDSLAMALKQAGTSQALA
ncbi:Ig-like domain-containing protein [Pseudomonas frederiksbergensis]|uniref:Ig-like domain-containing protein n=1 Tax=Pseudomonas frederiksbergensis TaxID=104087 RepID=UPI002DBA72FC|nr:Ig-like domain-containing protein [Pseudomonas frederiksbergensis]WRV68697.1 Ig-like domain-containing protein [Pseudomonas frederiksbergensis]